jgi:hypothetical protein
VRPSSSLLLNVLLLVGVTGVRCGDEQHMCRGKCDRVCWLEANLRETHDLLDVVNGFDMTAAFCVALRIGGKVKGAESSGSDRVAAFG